VVVGESGGLAGGDLGAGGHVSFGVVSVVELAVALQAVGGAGGVGSVEVGGGAVAGLVVVVEFVRVGDSAVVGGEELAGGVVGVGGAVSLAALAGDLALEIVAVGEVGPGVVERAGAVFVLDLLYPALRGDLVVGGAADLIGEGAVGEALQAGDLAAAIAINVHTGGADAAAGPDEAVAAAPDIVGGLHLHAGIVDHGGEAAIFVVAVEEGDGRQAGGFLHWRPG